MARWSIWLEQGWIDQPLWTGTATSIDDAIARYRETLGVEAVAEFDAANPRWTENLFVSEEED
jgi:hypothetical protein